VGPQVSFGEVSVHSAPRQAVSAAQDAVVQAAALGFGPGTPIYYDMESYAPGQSRAALTFFSSWTTQLHALGYRSAIYSSSSSGISDLARNYNGGTYAMPDVIDDAWWNGVADTSDPNVPAGEWANHQRVHQYSGNVTAKHGGYRINIDKDYLDVQLGSGGSGGGGGGGTSAAPARQASAAVAAPGSVVDAFYAGADQVLWCVRYRPSQGWAAPVSLGDALTSQPSAVTAAHGSVMVFYQGTNGGLETVTSRSGGGWATPRSLHMGRLGSGPAAVSTADGGIDVFWRGKDPSQLWGARLVPGSGWRGPSHLAGGLASAPSPAVSGASTVSVFWKGTDGKLWHISRGSMASWRHPAPLPMGQLGSGPYASGQRAGQIDVVWGGTGRGSIWHATYSPAGGWSRQSMLALGRRGIPALVASSGGTADAFWKGRKAELWHATSHAGSGWGGPAILGMGKIGGGVFAAGRASGMIDVFWKGSGSPHLWHARYHPGSSRWTGPDDLGGDVG
jgi:Rv2525c-like, glycoside hydrolase-like domain